MINSKKWHLSLELRENLPLTYRRVLFVYFKIAISKLMKMKML